MEHLHIPVLRKEVLLLLDPKPGETFIDCTLGEGGHAEAILERISPHGRLIAIDLDAESIARARKRLQQFADQLVTVHESFSHLADIARREAGGQVDGILLDLGLSRFEVKEGKRGFSFDADEFLDMRLDRTSVLTASDIINRWPLDKLIWIFQEYGQERFSRRIAAQVCRLRQRQPITTTQQLSEAVLLAIRRSMKSPHKVPWMKGGHPATRVFQALRIAVNDELNVLQSTLPQAVEALVPGGRCAVISFHSLEDRIVKHFFRSEDKNGRVRILTPKPVTAGQDEQRQNRSSRSAKLRAIQKI